MSLNSKSVFSKKLYTHQAHERANGMQRTDPDFLLPGYEDLELSTQMVIREAMARGVEIDILDRRDNFIRLRKGSRSELVRQATMTTLDPLVSYFVMENKQVTKTLLSEEGFRVPKGKIYFSIQDALADYARYASMRCVVKPNFTNYGVGVNIVPEDDPELFQDALRDAFQHGQEVIVEEYFAGQEYRFLVINGEVEAVCKRLPANVVGDGKSSIRQLVRRKNDDPSCYKIPAYRIRLQRLEKQVLAEQGLTPSLVLAEGQRVFLRHNSNVSTGGDPVDVTDQATIPYGNLAVAAAALARAHFCGVDLIVRDFSQEPSEDNHCFIELNFNPALYLHRYPVEGQKRYVEKAVLDQLGF